MQELRARDRDRVFNLGYYTWVEQQGVSLAEFEARRHQSFWRGLRGLLPVWDEMIAGVQRAQSRDCRRAVTLGYPEVVVRGLRNPRVAWAPGAPDPFRCPASRPGDDIDHVLKPAGDAEGWRNIDGSSAQPFVRYRGRLYSYHLARVGGLADTEFCDIVAELDRAIEAVDGRGFRVTPTAPAPRLARALGLERSGLWVKDETGNVSGSHKGRHLFGVMLYLHGQRASARHWRGEPCAAGDRQLR